MKPLIPLSMLAPDTQAMIGWVQQYFDAFPERTEINYEEFSKLVHIRLGDGNPENLALMRSLIAQMAQPVDDVTLRGIVSQLYELSLSGEAAALITKYQNGEEIDLAYELGRLSQKTLRSMGQSCITDYETTPIETILGEISNDRGLKWTRLKVLHDHIAGLLGGASIAVGARPDKGKTSLIAETLTDWAPQIATVFGPNRPIAWLNNEGTAKRIIPRVYQATLKKSLPEIIALSNAGQLQEQYTKAIGGVPDLIRVKDMHGQSLAQVEQLVEQWRPAVVVFDMLANFRMGSVAGGNKADAVEQAWQEVREMAVRHDFVAISTVQVSAEGDNMLFPPYSALKDSKTGIQGATDVILMMGALNDPNFQKLRGLSTPKNKYQIAGRPSCAQSEVQFDAATCAFTEGV